MGKQSLPHCHFSRFAKGRACIGLCSIFALGLSLSACDAQEIPDEDRPSSEDDGVGIKPSEDSKKQSSEDEVPDEALPDEDNQNKPDDDGEQKDEDCGESNFQAERVPPNVMLVLDKSGSMSAEQWEDNGTRKSRWSSLHATTKFLLESFGEQVNFGVKLFPSIQKGSGFDLTKSCKVDAGIDAPCKPNNAKAIMDLLPPADADFMGSTPTVSGLREAYSHLSTLNDPNPEAAILIVDGRTNCQQSNLELAATAAQAKAKGILVYVVGIDLDAATLASLAPVAVAGGTEKIYNSADSNALAASLKAIVGGISSCTIPLDSTPPYPEYVKVEIGKNSVLHPLQGFGSCEEAAKAGKTAGWIYPGLKGPFNKIELCGESCDAFKAAPKVDVAYECPPPV